MISMLFQSFIDTQIFNFSSRKSFRSEKDKVWLAFLVIFVLATMTMNKFSFSWQKSKTIFPSSIFQHQKPIIGYTIGVVNKGRHVHIEIQFF